jgi:hypothetical protein
VVFVTDVGIDFHARLDKVHGLRHRNGDDAQTIERTHHDKMADLVVDTNGDDVAFIQPGFDNGGFHRTSTGRQHAVAHHPVDQDDGLLFRARAPVVHDHVDEVHTPSLKLLPAFERPSSTTQIRRADAGQRQLSRAAVMSRHKPRTAMATTRHGFVRRDLRLIAVIALASVKEKSWRCQGLLTVGGGSLSRQAVPRRSSAAFMLRSKTFATLPVPIAPGGQTQ